MPRHPSTSHGRPGSPRVPHPRRVNRGQSLCGVAPQPGQVPLDGARAEARQLKGPPRMPSTQSRTERILSDLRVAPGTPANLAGRSTTWKGDDEFGDMSRKELDATAKKILAQGVDALADAQE